jgi:hypothetical protein
VPGEIVIFCSGDDTRICCIPKSTPAGNAITACSVLDS